MNLKHLECFLAVVRFGGFREAAKRTGKSQPALSQNIRKLESELGASLIQRQHNGCSPTDRGRAFVPYAESLLRTSSRARALFEGNSLAVAAGSNIGIYLMPPFLRSYRDAHPQEQVELSVHGNPEVARRLCAREVEVAVMEWWDGQPGFIAEPWRREELVLIVPPEHRWAERGVIAPEQLHDCSLLGGESGSGTGRILQDRLSTIHPSLRVSAHLGSTEAVKRAVQAGLGISLVLASSVEQEVAAGSLAAVRIAEVNLEKQLYVVRDKDSPEDSPARRFAEHLLG